MRRRRRRRRLGAGRIVSRVARVVLGDVGWYGHGPRLVGGGS